MKLLVSRDFSFSFITSSKRLSCLLPASRSSPRFAAKWASSFVLYLALNFVKLRVFRHASSFFVGDAVAVVGGDAAEDATDNTVDEEFVEEALLSTGGTAGGFEATAAIPCDG